MGTTPIKKPDEPPAIESAVRSAIAGHPRGAVRRIVLWIVAYMGLVVGWFTLPPMGLLTGVAFLFAFVALLLLMLTDGLL